LAGARPEGSTVIRFRRLLEILTAPWIVNAPDALVNRGGRAQPSPVEGEAVRVYSLGVYDLFWIWARRTR
jgi:hypothetical protein